MRTILLASLLGVPLSAQTYVVTPAQYTRSEGSTTRIWKLSENFATGAKSFSGS